MIYCIEDDDSIRELELYAMQASGFPGKGFPDAKSFWTELESADAMPRLILLDIMLPGEDGISVLKKLRTNPETEAIPVIMTTAKGTEYDKVVGLDAGADDYLAKPFGMLEMIARIKAVLRRTERISSGNGLAADANTSIDAEVGNDSGSSSGNISKKGADHGIIKVKGIVLDKLQHLVFVKDKEINLTVKEFDILQLFMENPNRVFSRDQLLSQIWGEEFLGESRTVDMHISTLRNKLGKQGKRIKTLRGVGYRLEEKSK